MFTCIKLVKHLVDTMGVLCLINLSDQQTARMFRNQIGGPVKIAQDDRQTSFKGFQCTDRHPLIP
jgi:hypothetical protein